MLLHVMVHPLILLHFLAIFIHFYLPFMPDLLYLRQTFTDCVSNQNTHFDMLKCQMLLQITEDFLVLSVFWKF